MPFSQIIPPSPSSSESKSPLYTSVSFFLSCIQGRHCHLLSGSYIQDTQKPVRNGQSAFKGLMCRLSDTKTHCKSTNLKNASTPGDEIY